MIDSSDITQLSAVAMAGLFRAGELSPTEALEAVLDRMDELEPEVNSFFTRTTDLARSEALASEARFRAGEPLTMMDGVPYSIKDLDATKGIRTTYGIPATKDFIPDADTSVVERLRSAGGSLLGKTSAPHIGYKDSSENMLFPATKNPWNLSRNPGGSSSGAAAAVAARFGPIAHGSDGAGSIRIPAGLCGVVGFKPTVGRIPVWPAGFYAGTTVHNGPITRTVEDAAMMTDIMAGPDERDPSSQYPLPQGGFLANLTSETVTGLRFGVTKDLGYGATAAEVGDAVVKAAELLTAYGHTVAEGHPGFRDPGPTQESRWNSLMASRFTHDLKAHPEHFDETLTAIVHAGEEASALSVWSYEKMRGEMHDKLVAFFHDFDYLITPSMPMGAWHRDTYPTEVDGKPLPGGGVLARAYLLWPFNFTGNSAITIPCGLTAEGMPIGIHVVGKMQDDLGVLRVAKQLEELIAFSDLAPVTDRG